jgi:hypothetical protein
MSTSKYLPPFTNEERSAVARVSGSTAPSAPVPREIDADATYADFLGDEIDD